MTSSASAVGSFSKHLRKGCFYPGSAKCGFNESEKRYRPTDQPMQSKKTDLN